jgi:hypothetical protein
MAARIDLRNHTSIHLVSGKMEALMQLVYEKDTKAFVARLPSRGVLADLGDLEIRLTEDMIRNITIRPDGRIELRL